MDGTTSIRAFVQRWQIPLIAGGVLLVGAALAAAYFAWFHQAYAVLFKDLRTMDAATIVAELDKRKTPYELRDGGRTILVPEKLVDTTRLSIMSQELPLKGVVGFELFNKSDMGLTEFAQRINYRRALQGELARTIMALETVESARVHLTLSEGSVFREDRKPSKASVTITPRGGQAISPQTIRGVQRMVAAAAPDLDSQDVVVLDELGAVVSTAEAAPLASPPPGVQVRAAIEGYYASRVRMALRGVLPDDQVAVTVAAGWNTDTAAATGDPFASWSPETRRFPLTVEVSTTAPVGPQVRDAMIALAGQTIGLRADRGDSVSVSLAPPAPASAALPAPSPPTVAAARDAPPQLAALGPEPSQLWIMAAAPLLVVMLAAAVFLHSWARRPRRLSARERDAYAARLRKLLDTGGADAVAGG